MGGVGGAEYHRVKDVNGRGLTNEAVNISSEHFIGFVSVRNSVVRCHHLKLMGHYAHCTHWKFNAIII